jgi:CheY-like chemotaxis protein
VANTDAFDLEMTPAPRLLLIEDHDELAEATAAFLCHYGFEVQVAQTGREAIQTAAAFLPEIVLCDMSLPDMSGFDIARELRRHPETGRVVFVIHSAMRKSDTGLSDPQLQALNVDLFLSKPLRAENIETLQRLRQKRQLNNPARKKANTL